MPKSDDEIQDKGGHKNVAEGHDNARNPENEEEDESDQVFYRSVLWGPSKRTKLIHCHWQKLGLVSGVHRWLVVAEIRGRHGHELV